ncbi:unnamed protein product [Cyclocybe aegerita]|uniref:F-box domain-containing protein n=1 Tax=Cyclocybe aegerita TaxID=1973307 RepID=A0A8S0WG91_CYCAE|nr:unnamed protein product [Cyclocybe aegerita]
MRRVPHDLLQEIFLACLPTDRNPSLSADEAPILITQVCSHWRHVAHSTPQLWASVHVAIPGYQGDVEYGELENIIHQRSAAVKDWIRLAGALPLTISAYEGHSLYATSYFSEFLQECLVPICDRWKDLSLSAYADSISNIQRLSTDQTPQLKSLHLAIKRRNGPEWDSPSGTWEQDVPVAETWNDGGGILGGQSLRELRLSVFDIPWEVTSKWNLLTTLVLNEDGRSNNIPLYSVTSRVKAVLRETKALIDCTLRIGHFDETWPHNETNDANDAFKDLPIELLLLKTLSIAEYPRVTLLPLLRTPSIRCMAYSRLVASFPPHNHPFLDFLVLNPGIHIEELSVDPNNITPFEMLESLRLCSSLRLLHLELQAPLEPWIQRFGPAAAGHPFTDELLTELAPPLNRDLAPALCPNLEDITFMRETQFSETAVVEFVKRKQDGDRHGMGKLRNIKVNFVRKKGERDLVAELALYQDSGLAMEFYYHPSNLRSPLSHYNGLASSSGITCW